MPMNEEEQKRMHNLERFAWMAAGVAALASLLLAAGVWKVFDLFPAVSALQTSNAHYGDELKHLRELVEKKFVAELIAHEGVVAYVKGDKIGVKTDGKETEFNLKGDTKLFFNDKLVKAGDLFDKRGDYIKVWTTQDPKNAIRVEIMAKK